MAAARNCGGWERRPAPRPHPIGLSLSSTRPDRRTFEMERSQGALGPGRMAPVRAPPSFEREQQLAGPRIPGARSNSTCRMRRFARFPFGQAAGCHIFGSSCRDVVCQWQSAGFALMVGDGVRMSHSCCRPLAFGQVIDVFVSRRRERRQRGSSLEEHWALMVNLRREEGSPSLRPLVLSRTEFGPRVAGAGSVIYSFGDCVLDTDRVTLHREGLEQSIEPQVFDVLIYLLEADSH